MCATAITTCTLAAVIIFASHWPVTVASDPGVPEAGDSVWQEITNQAGYFRRISLHYSLRVKRGKQHQWPYRPINQDCKKQLDSLLDVLHTVADSQKPSCKYDSSLPSSLATGKYLIGLNLHNNQVVLPHIITQLTHLLLGTPSDVTIFISVYESGSTDQTLRLLTVLKDILRGLRVPHRILAGSPDSIKWEGKKKHRIAFLASVRNRVLEPLWPLHSHASEPYMFSHDISADDDGTLTELEQNLDKKTEDHSSLRKLSEPQNQDQPAPPAPPDPRVLLRFKHHPSSLISLFDLPALGFPADKVVFINDVYVCTQDIIRLASHSADMACGTDYNVWDHFIKLYDTWVIRDVTGMGPSDEPPYFTHQYTVDRLKSGLPVPMYSCWNGMVALNAKPFRDGLRMRSHTAGECASSECTLLADDFWRLRYTRVLMDPSVRLAYSNTLFSQFGKLFDEQVKGYFPVTTWDQVLKSPIDWSVAQQPKSRMCCEISPNDNLVQHGSCMRDYDPFKVNYTEVAMKNGFDPSWVSITFSK